MSSYLGDQASIAKELCQHRALFKVLKKISPSGKHAYICMYGAR